METEYIESYFEQTLNDEDRKAFENRISNDENFAKDVAFYVGTRAALREELLQQKQKAWTANDIATATEDNINKATLLKVSPVRKIGISKWWSYVAAACLLLVVGLFLFERKSTPQQLAKNYIATDITHTSLTMDGSKDSMQLGEAAFGDKAYDKALPYFIGVAAAHPDNVEAKEMAGNVYLVTNNYDKALQQFDELANVKGLRVNPGLFLKAVTLMQRNNNGDLVEAKQLLQQVVKENLTHSDKAAEWLKKF